MMRYIIIIFVDILRLSWDSSPQESGHDSMLCVILALEMILNILYISFFIIFMCQCIYFML